MKMRLLLALVLGTVVGLVLRKANPTIAKGDQQTSRQSSEERTVTDQAQEVAQTAQLHIDLSLAAELKGNLSSAEILEMPKGNLRLAELMIFVQSADFADLADHWAALHEDEGTGYVDFFRFASLWASRDPEGALAAIQSGLDGGDDRLYWWLLARTNPRAELSRTDRSDHKQFSTMLRSIGLEDPELALEFLDELEGERSYAIDGIVGGFFKKDPQRAIEFGLSEGHNISAFLRRWTSDSPREAFEWTLVNRRNPLVNMGELAQSLVARDPSFFEQALNQIPSGRTKVEFQRALASHLAIEDPDAAMNAAMQADGLAKSEMLSAIGKRVAISDPALARKALAELIPSYQGRDSSGLANWPYDDESIRPPDPWQLSWVEDLIQVNPDEVMDVALNDQSETARKEAFSKWMKLDQEGGLRWILHRVEGQVEGGLAQVALKQVSQSGSGFEAALPLVQQIENEQEQSGTLQNLVNSWYLNDEKGLQEYLDKTPVSPAFREAFKRKGYN